MIETKPEQYRKWAANALAEAERLGDSADRDALLQLAAIYLAKAERLEREAGKEK